MIEYRSAELNFLFNKYTDSSANKPPQESDKGELTHTDKALITKIQTSKQSEKFNRLFEGNTEGYGSQSEADMALCSILAFWTGKDAAQMDRIFRQSDLYRAKWDELHGDQTYGQMTIQRAIEGTRDIYKGNQVPPKPEPQRGGFRLIQADELEVKPIQWLIFDYLEQDSLALLFGDPGCGKSFLAIDMALCVATGGDFHNHSVVRPGPAIFIAGEGRNGLKRRITAWSKANKISHEGSPFFISSMPASLTDAIFVDQIMSAVNELQISYGPPVLIVIDTLARNFGPGDENSTQDMGKFIQAADTLRAMSQATVLIVHHTGHSDKGRARGAMALKGALDAEFRLDKGEDGVIRLEATKMKEAEHPKPLAFRLHPVEFLCSEFDVTPSTSAVLKAVSFSPPPKKGKAGQGKHQTRTKELLNNLFHDKQKDLSDLDKDPGAARVSIEELKSAMKGDGIPAKQVGDIIKSLLGYNIITEENGYVKLL